MKSFNFKRFLADNEFRPALSFTMNRNGYRVATNDHILCALRTDYPAGLEGKLTDLDGNIHECYMTVEKGEKKMVPLKFPNFEDVRPDKSKMAPVRIDLKRIAAFASECRHEQHTRAVSGHCLVSFGGKKAFFSVRLMDDFVTFMHKIGTDILWIENETRAAYVEGQDGSWGVIMPSYLTARDGPDIAADNQDMQNIDRRSTVTPIYRIMVWTKTKGGHRYEYIDDNEYTPDSLPSKYRGSDYLRKVVRHEPIVR